MVDDSPPLSSFLSKQNTPRERQIKLSSWDMNCQSTYHRLLYLLKWLATLHSSSTTVTCTTVILPTSNSFLHCTYCFNSSLHSVYSLHSLEIDPFSSLSRAWLMVFFVHPCISAHVTQSTDPSSYFCTSSPSVYQLFYRHFYPVIHLLIHVRSVDVFIINSTIVCNTYKGQINETEYCALIMPSLSLIGLMSWWQASFSSLPTNIRSCLSCKKVHEYHREHQW